MEIATEEECRQLEEPNLYELIEQLLIEKQKLTDFIKENIGEII